LSDDPDPGAPAVPESPASPPAPADVESTTAPSPFPVVVSSGAVAQDDGAAPGSEAPEVIDAPASKSDEESAATLAEAKSELHAVDDDQANPAAGEPPLDEDSEPRSEDDGKCGPDIQIQCFGAFRVLCYGKEMKPEGVEYNMYRPWEVLAYLAIQPAGPIPRRRLIDDIWADWDEVEAEKIYARVRTVLARIRKVFERQVPELREPVVSLDRNGMVSLNLRVVHSEAHEFLELARSSATLPPPQAMDACRRARALYRGDLLADCQYEWLFSPAAPSGSEQQVYRQKYRTVTARLAQLYAEQGQRTQAVTLYRQILRDDAGNEKVACRLFECQAQMGDITALQRDYRWLDHTYREQYRSRLGPKVVAAYEAAMASLSVPHVSATAPSAGSSAS
jgi:two-component SAPR family response regulator